MLIAIAIAEEIQGSKDCIGARTQKRTSLGLVSHMNFDNLMLPPGLHAQNLKPEQESFAESTRRPGGNPEEISNENGFMWGTRPSAGKLGFGTYPILEVL